MRRERTGVARWVGLVVVGGWCLGCEGGPLPPEGEAEFASSSQDLAQSFVFTPVADARVSSAYPTTNFGGDSALSVDTTPYFESHLRFNVTGVAGQVVSAKLRLYAFDGTDVGPIVYRTQGAWTESSLTWNNRPARSGPDQVATGAIQGGGYVELDVTWAVQANGEYSFALAPRSGDAINFRSKESSDRALWPQLLVTVEPCLTRTDAFEGANDVWFDTYVSAAEPTARFSSASELVVGASPRRDAYLRVNIRNSAQTLRRAVLRLWARDSTVDGPKLYRLEESWPSSDPSWDYRPAIVGGPLADVGPITAGTWVEYDVTSAVHLGQGSMTYGFALVADSADEARFVSRDGATSGDSDHGPRVVITWESAPYCWYRGNGGGRVDRSQQLGAAGSESVSATAVTPTGELVVAGITSAGGSFGGSTFPAAGMVVARYTADGTPLWSRRYGDSAVQPTAVTVTPQGNVLVVGTYTGSPDLGTGPLLDAGAETPNMFIAKLSPTGEPAWARGFLARAELPSGTCRGPIRPRAVASDTSESLIVTGGFFCDADFGGGALHSESYSEDQAEPGMFIAKFSWAGRHLWSQAYAGGSGEAARTEGLALATDAGGNILLGGVLGTFAGLGFTFRGGSFVAKLNPAGTILWRRGFGDSSGAVDKVVFLPDGRVGFAGHFAPILEFGGWTYTAHPRYQDLMVGTLTAAGFDEWLRQIGFQSDFRAIGLGVDAQGRLAVASTFGTASNAGGGALGMLRSDVGPGALGFVARYASADGTHLWSRTFDPDLHLQGLSVQPGGAVMGVGQFSRAIDIDGRTFRPRGGDDVLLLRLTP